MVGQLGQTSRERLLIILAREPVPGLTKTRLGATIGMERASALYEGFLTDLATHFSPCATGDDFTVAWAVTPESRCFDEVLRGLTGEGLTDGLLHTTQCGPDFGARQVNLLCWGHQLGYERTVLIASDSPQVTTCAVIDAFCALDRAEVALGRVRDGGYYLIGVRGNHDPISGVPMSVGNVADGVCRRARSLNLRVAEIGATFDVDIEDDLERLIAAIQPDGKQAPATWAALRRLGLLLDG